MNILEVSKKLKEQPESFMAIDERGNVIEFKDGSIRYTHTKTAVKLNFKNLNTNYRLLIIQQQLK